MQLKIFWHYGGCLNKRAASSTTTKSTAEAVLFVVVELKAAKTHTVLYQINRTEYYCQVDLPLSDYPLYGK